MDDKRKKTVYETSSDQLAGELFRADPEGALSATRLVSAEGNGYARDDWSASPNRKKSKMVYELAAGQSERFLELVSYLPHVIQDIFYQYFLLGRTQTQIGELLGMSQKQVWQALEVGVDGIAAVSKTGELSEACFGFTTNAETREELVLEEPTTLGEFILRTGDGALEANFAPGTPDGPAR